MSRTLPINESVKKKVYFFKIIQGKAIKYIPIFAHAIKQHDIQNRAARLAKTALRRRGRAYRFFFKEYYQILGSFAQQYVKEEMIAEDIVNDVIYELYRNKKSFPDIVSLKSFLFTSIKHRSLNYIRGKKAQERYLQDPQVANDTEEFFLDAIIEEEVYFLMHKAITELPEKIQEIYKLSLSGESNEAIAAQLHLTIDSVKAYKKRGKQILKKKLQNLLLFLSVTL